MERLNLPPHGVIVIWEWQWVENISESSVTHASESTVNHISETSFGDLDFDSDETHCSEFSDTEESPVYSTVTFKCIGTQYDDHAQVIFGKVSQLLDHEQEVPVNLFPEPDNPKDAKAIAFKCWIEDKWHRIGYVVKEAQDSVHEARASDAIINMKFSWAQYLLCWTESGPGYYAGINITKRGLWSATVDRSASTR